MRDQNRKFLWWMPLYCSPCKNLFTMLRIRSPCKNLFVMLQKIGHWWELGLRWINDCALSPLYRILLLLTTIWSINMRDALSKKKRKKSILRIVCSLHLKWSSAVPRTFHRTGPPSPWWDWGAEQWGEQEGDHGHCTWGGISVSNC